VNAILPGAVDTPMLRAGMNRGHVSGRPFMNALKIWLAKQLMAELAPLRKLPIVSTF